MIMGETRNHTSCQLCKSPKGLIKACESMLSNLKINPNNMALKHFFEAVMGMDSITIDKGYGRGGYTIFDHASEYFPVLRLKVKGRLISVRLSWRAEHCKEESIGPVHLLVTRIYGKESEQFFSSDGLISQNNSLGDYFYKLDRLHDGRLVLVQSSGQLGLRIHHVVPLETLIAGGKFERVGNKVELACSEDAKQEMYFAKQLYLPELQERMIAEFKSAKGRAPTDEETLSPGSYADKQEQAVARFIRETAILDVEGAELSDSPRQRDKRRRSRAALMGIRAEVTAYDANGKEWHGIPITKDEYDMGYHLLLKPGTTCLLAASPEKNADWGIAFDEALVTPGKDEGRFCTVARDLTDDISKVNILILLKRTWGIQKTFLIRGKPIKCPVLKSHHGDHDRRPISGISNAFVAYPMAHCHEGQFQIFELMGHEDSRLIGEMKPMN